MINHGMLVCSFSLRKRFQKSLHALNHSYTFQKEDIEVSADNAVEMFRRFCETNKEYTDDEKRKKVFCVKEGSFQEDMESSYSALSFVIKSGGYGVESEITDRLTNQVNYKRKANESDVKEFLCVVYIPQDVENLQIKKGIFIFQSIGNYGVKTITVDRMRAFFADMELTLETRCVSTAVFLERLINQGSLYQMTLIWNRPSVNPADGILISTGREERTYVNPKLSDPFKNKLFSKCLNPDKPGVIEILDQENVDDILLQFRMGGRMRTVRFSNLDQLSIVEDIPQTIVQGNDRSEIRAYMIQTAEEYRQQMVWGQPDEV